MPEESHQAGPTPTALIADDDALIRTVLSSQLRDDFEVVGTAGDAAEAVSLAEDLRPDIAIVDVQMPEGGGLHAAREIKRRSPATTVVALSADEEDHTVREMLQSGAIAYVRKGVSTAELKHKLRASLAAERALAGRDEGASR